MVKYEDAKKVIIVKLGSPKSANEELLKVSYDEAIERVKNYCSVEEIPMGLFHTLTNIARDLYLFYNSFTVQEDSGSQGGSSSVDISSIESIKMGDTTISLKDNVAVSSPTDRDYSEMHNYNIDHIVETYADSLNEYRRLVW